MLTSRCAVVFAAALALAGGSARADEPEPAPAGDEAGPQEGDGDAKGEPEGEPADDPDPDAQGKKQGRKKQKKDRRELDPGSPVTEALERLLTVPHRYATDGTVQLVYTFTEPDPIHDWELSGFDRAEEVGRKNRRRKRAAKPKRLAIGAGSQRPGLLLHRLHLGEVWEVRVTGRITRMAPSTDLVLFVGKAGVRFGAQLVRRGSRGFSPLERGPDPDRTSFDRGRTFQIVLRCRDGEVTAALNGTVVAASRRFGDAARGQVGVYARNLMLLIDKVEIEGQVDRDEL